MKKMSLLLIGLLIGLVSYSQTIRFGSPVPIGNDSTSISIIFDSVPPLCKIWIGFHYNASVYSLKKIYFWTHAAHNYSNVGIFNFWWSTGSNTVFQDTVIKFLFKGRGCEDFIFGTPFSNYPTITNIAIDSCYLSTLSGIIPAIYENYLCNSSALQDPISDNFKIHSIDHNLHIENSDFKEIEVIDMLGRIVLKAKLIIGQNDFYITKKGIYIVRLMKRNLTFNKKIII